MVETRQYLGILWRRKWVILVATLAAVGVAALGSYLQQPVFSASAMIRVAQGSRGSIQYVDAIYAERLMNTYRDLLQSRPFLANAIERLGLPTSVEVLSKQVKVEVVLDTELLRVIAEDADAARAQRIANTLAALFVEQSRSLYSGSGESVLETLHKQLTSVEADLQQNRTALQTLRSNPSPDQAKIEELAAKVAMGEGIYANLLRQYDDMRLTEESRANSVTLAEPASVPVEPVRPRKTLNLVLGLFVGALSGIGLAFLFESLDPALHSRRDLEGASDLPILASIPNFKTLRGTRQGAIGVDGRVYSPLDEAFGILREAILSAKSDSPGRTLLIASAEPGAGKSTILSNLAVAIAQGGQRVIVVDADFRRPVLHDVFGVSNDEGLTSVLQGISDLAAVLQHTDFPGVRVLTSGPLIPDAMRLPGLTKLADLLNQLLGEADIILVDSPPILTVADASQLATKVDGVLLVATRELATAEGIRRAVQQLQRLGARVVGLVYNGAHVSDDYYYYYYAHAGRRRKAPLKRVVQAPSLRVGATGPGISEQRDGGRGRGLRGWLVPGVVLLLAILAVCVSLVVPEVARVVREFSSASISLAWLSQTPIPSEPPAAISSSPEPGRTPEVGQLSQGVALTGHPAILGPSPEATRTPEVARLSPAAVPAGRSPAVMPSPELDYAPGVDQLSQDAVPTGRPPVLVPSYEPTRTPEASQWSQSAVTADRPAAIVPSSGPNRTSEEDRGSWSDILTSRPSVLRATPAPDHTPEVDQLLQSVPAVQRRETGVVSLTTASALITPESWPVILPTLSVVPRQDALRARSSPPRLETSTPTASSQVEFDLPAQITFGLASPARGIIASGSNSELSGVFVLKGPRLWKPEVIWLPDGWRVDILSAEMLISSDGPAEWWYHVKPASLRDAYAGYVPASAVLAQR